MMDLKQIRASERLRKEIAAKHKEIELEVLKKLKAPPFVSKEHRQQIENMLDQISSFAEYTFNYQESIGELEVERPNGIENRAPFVWVSPGNYSLSHYEYANREALKLKREIKRLLQDYKYFYQGFPDYATLGTSNVFKKYQFHNVDAYVSKVEKTLEELRCYGEQEAYELKETGANMAYMLGVKESEMNGR